MKTYLRLSSFLALGTVTANAAAVDLQGSDRLAQMTRSIVEACTLTSEPFGYLPTTSSAAESSLLAETQLIAPMSRFLGTSICSASAAQLSQASGAAIAIDGVVVTGASMTAGTCGGVRSSGSIAVGTETYTFANWRDVLRVLYSGVGHDGVTDCNGAVRRTIADSWSSVFQGTCTGGSCTAVHRLWRPADRSDTASLMLSLLALPSLAANPAVFCNGTEIDDHDPIRRPCTNDEQVCSKAGDLGLVVPVVQTDFLSAGDAFPVAPCTTNMMFAQVANRPDGALDRCPNGDIPVFGNLCLVPVDASGSPGCLAAKKTKPAFVFDNTPVDGVAPNRADGRAYNLHLHKLDGTYQVDNTLTPPRQMTRAYHRIHSKAPAAGGVACTERDATLQIGCLVQASACSLGFTGVQALGTTGVAALDLNGVPATIANMQNVATRVAPIYPFAQVAYLNTLSGFNALGAIDPPQAALANCFFNRPIVEAAATAAGLIPLASPPACQDFNEMALCGAPRNDNACGISFNVCPGIDSIDVSPLETRVGTTITLNSAASDIDNAPEPLTYEWSTTSGSIAAPRQPNTTFTCTIAGTATITLTVNDGGNCPDTRTIPITCSP